MSTWPKTRPLAASDTHATNASREAAATSGLMRERGPGVLAIEGAHDAVMQAFGSALAAALAAAARELEARFESPKESRG